MTCREHESDEYDSLGKSQMRVIDRLQKHGILGPNTITAHGIHFDAREMEILKETGTWLTHQPRSNMNNGVGVATGASLTGSTVIATVAVSEPPKVSLTVYCTLTGPPW